MDKRSSSETTNLVGANTFCQLHKRIKGFSYTKETQAASLCVSHSKNNAKNYSH